MSDAWQAWQWLAREGHEHLRGAVVLNQTPLRVDWGASGSRLRDWQRAMLEEQLRFRARCRDRFPSTEKWLWTDRSLQQASDWTSAQVKADWFECDLPVVDACCGAGADLVALAQKRSVVGFDRDRLMVQLSQANLQAHGLSGWGCVAELPQALGDLSRCGLHIDPDRRTLERGTAPQGRTTWGEGFSPPLSVAMQLGRRAKAAVIKLAPATKLEEMEATERDGWQRCWLGVGRECPQQLLLTGALRLSIPSGMQAAVLCSGQGGYDIFSHSPAGTAWGLERPLQFIHEPHACLYASGLAWAWAENNGMTPFPQDTGYFTSDKAIASPWVQTFEVIDDFSWDDRRMRSWLRKRGAGPLEVKTRLVSIDANAIQRRYSQKEGEPLVCLMTRIGKSVRAILARRTAQPG